MSINREALFQLKRIVRKVGSKKYARRLNMDNYLAMDNLEKHISNPERICYDNPHPALNLIPEGFCNTTACLAGHAGLDKWFQDKGLKSVFHHYDRSNSSLIGEVEFDGNTNNRALVNFFGLTNAESQGLFGSCKFNKDRWLKKIDEILKNGK